MSDDELIERWIEPDPNRPWVGEAVLRDYGVHVWALIGYYLQAVDQDAAEVAHDYDIPREAVEAALAFYRRHQCEIDVRLAQNASSSAV